MATNKKSINNDSSLYIQFNDVKEKRKNLLLAIKKSLILQEEYEKLVAIRSEKRKILKEIKEKFEKINLNYQKIKREIPSMKTIEDSEREINKLDNEVTSIDIKNKKLPKNINKSNSKTNNKNQPQQNSSKQEVSKLDRLKNNLKVIESKLNKL